MWKSNQLTLGHANTKTTDIMTPKKDKLAFIEKDRGYSVKAWYLKKPNNGDALIIVYKGRNKLREFLFPAYKIYNIAAHFSDIVNSEIEKNIDGYAEAASTGFGGSVAIKPLTK